MIIVIGYYRMVNTIRHFSSQKCQKIMVHHMDVGGGSRCLVPAGSLTPKQWGEAQAMAISRGTGLKPWDVGKPRTTMLERCLEDGMSGPVGGHPKSNILLLDYTGLT